MELTGYLGQKIAEHASVKASGAMFVLLSEHNCIVSGLYLV